jgi:hypothetical protein
MTTPAHRTALYPVVFVTGKPPQFERRKRNSISTYVEFISLPHPRPSQSIPLSKRLFACRKEVSNIQSEAKPPSSLPEKKNSRHELLHILKKVVRFGAIFPKYTWARSGGGNIRCEHFLWLLDSQFGESMLGVKLTLAAA